jgi:ABC-2 type transport system ATP-binding protein
VLLTSHYMADVQALCKRVVVIDHGTILYDGSLRALSTRFAQRQTITATIPDRTALDSLGEVVSVDGDRVTLRVDKDRSAAVAGRLLAEHGVTDLTIEDPPVEDVIEQVFAAGTLT